MYNYTQAPLPFQGQKRRFLKEFKTALNDFSSTATYVDLFGGYGFLSHTVKQHFPDAKVIYNDFDGYSHRMENVDKTNALLKDIREIVKPLPDMVKISSEYKQQIIDRIKAEPGFVDCVTLSSSLCFSSKYVTSVEELEKEGLYNNVKQKNYCTEGYLDGVDRVRLDYKVLFNQYRNKHEVVYLIDPPYLSTDTSTYNKDNYWKLGDYLDVLKCLQGTSYFYFTSNKSQIVELCTWLEENTSAQNPFAGGTTVTKGAQLNCSSRYNDIIIYKNKH